MVSQLAMPREGHLECVYQIFAYLSITHNSRMVFDPTYPDIDMSQFKECEWKIFYASTKEVIPGNTPEPRGKEVDLRLYVDSEPLSGPTYTYGDNLSVIHNTQRPESVLRKKSNSICYHVIRESVGMEEILTAHIRTAENPADLGTKVVPGGQKRYHIVSKLLFDLTD